MLHIYEKIILTMNKVNEIVSKYADRLKSFGIKLSAEGTIEAAAPVKMSVAILKDGTEVSSPDELVSRAMAHAACGSLAVRSCDRGCCRVLGHEVRAAES